MIRSLLSIIMLLLSVNTHAATNSSEERPTFYLRLDTGISLPKTSLSSMEYPENKLPSSCLYGLGIGYIFNNHIRGDFILSKRHLYKYRYYELNSGDKLDISQNFHNISFISNFYYDFIRGDILTPYVYIGTGVSLNFSGNYKDVFFDSEDNSETITKANSTFKYNLAWNLGGGIQAKLKKNLYVDFSCRYIMLGSFAETTYKNDKNSYNLSPGKIDSFEFLTSIKYNF